MKKLKKVWLCPTCGNRFMAGETRVEARAGRTCENGHFHSYYDYTRFEQGKPVSQIRTVKPRKQEVGQSREFVVSPNVTNQSPGSSERDWHLAMLWVGAYDRLMSQLPRGVARNMVDGALGLAYKASLMIVDGRKRVELRKVA